MQDEKNQTAAKFAFQLMISYSDFIKFVVENVNCAYKLSKQSEINLVTG